MATKHPDLQHQNVIDDLFNIGQQWLKTNELTPATVVAFATSLMIAVQTMLRGKGQEKKEIVIRVLKKCITLHNLPEEDRLALLGLCDTLVRVSIDAIKGAKDLFVNQKSCC